MNVSTKIFAAIATLALSMAGFAQDADSDEELKMIALHALISAPPERAMPLLKKVLAGDNSDELKENGLRITGVCPDGDYVEIVEIADHPWFLACQFHPEFKSKPLSPHPLFLGFVEASHAARRERMAADKA